MNTSQRLLLPILLTSLAVGLAAGAALASPSAEGEFVSAEKRRAAGHARLVETDAGAREIRLSDDFRRASGPDLFVVLIKQDRPENGRDVRKAGYVALGRLRSTRGAQSYAVPADVDLSEVGAVGIWCEEYSVLFSVASLAATGG